MTLFRDIWMRKSDWNNKTEGAGTALDITCETACSDMHGSQQQHAAIVSNCHSLSQHLTPPASLFAYSYGFAPGSGALQHDSQPPDLSSGESLWHVVKVSLGKHYLSWTFQLQVFLIHGNAVTQCSVPINLCLQIWLWQRRVGWGGVWGGLLCISSTGWATQSLR